MLKCFCDKCGNQIDRPNHLELRVHLFAEPGRGYVDQDFNSVSGNTKVLDLCNECYNIVGYAAVKKLNEEIE